MLKVGQVEQVEITGYTSEGLGVCRVDGCAVFVPNAIRGEVCRIRLTHVSRNSAHGKIEQILERSAHRISRACAEARLCGGCQLHHMDYEEELNFKAQKVYDALTRLGGQRLSPAYQTTGNGQPVAAHISAPHAAAGSGRPAAAHISAPHAAAGSGQQATEKAFPLGGRCPSLQTGADEGTSDDRPVPITGAEEINAYRNKAQYPVAVKNGRPAAGFYKNRTHDVVPVTRCAILPEVFDRARDTVIRWAEEDRVPVYDEHTGKGLLRHIYVRRGAVSGQVMVCVVANGEQLPRENRLVNALRRAVPGLASVILSVNRRDTNVVLGDCFRTLWGQEWIEDVLCGFTFRLSPRSFYQVNHDQAQRLYEKAVELADLHGTETVLDLYCGTGTITLALSRRAGKAVGVEVVPEAIEDAKENAARNGVSNVEFFCADASIAAARLCAEGRKPHVILVDPPRKGLAPEVIDAMAAMAPQRIVYVSCDPATLARDVKLLTEKGYALQSAEAFDLFPRTFHVETVVRLSRQ